MTRFHRDRAAMFDLAATSELAGLFQAPRDRRDDAWLARFYPAAWFASLELPSNEAMIGPDNMPYLRLDMPRPGAAFDSQSLGNLVEDCLARGIGAAICSNPDDPPEAAEFVFNFGMLDSMLRYDSAEGDPADLEDWARPLPPPAPAKKSWFGLGKAKEPEREVLIATPSAQFLPPHAARALHHYLQVRWELEDPRVALFVDMGLRPTRNLVIGRKRSTFPDQAFLDDLMRYTTWYLPPGRGLGLMPEHWSADSMTPLRELC